MKPIRRVKDIEEEMKASLIDILLQNGVTLNRPYLEKLVDKMITDFQLFLYPPPLNEQQRSLTDLKSSITACLEKSLMRHYPKIATIDQPLSNEIIRIVEAFSLDYFLDEEKCDTRMKIISM